MAFSAETKPQWRVIQQPMFSLIYEANIHQQAEHVATKLNHYLQAHLNEMPLKRPLKPIPIVLYSRAHTSNGNVGLMPYRSQWFNKPAPFAQLEWYDALAVHEGRHIVQFNQLGDNPVANILQYALGETGTGAFAGLFLPAWFFEGDAVVSETLMTAGGRGRTASFDLWLRADSLANSPYRYDRAMLGTGFDRTPSQSPYVMGRYLTAYLRNEYGSDLFDRAINRLATPAGFSFDGAIKQETGHYLSEHYHRMMQRLVSEWRQDQLSLEVSKVEPLTQFNGEHWQSYYPVSINEDGVVAVKVDAKLGSWLVSIEAGQSLPITPLTNRAARSYYGGSKTSAVVQHNDQWCWIEEKPDSKKPYRETADLYCWSKADGEQQLSVGERFTYVGTSQEQFLLNRFNEDRRSEFVLLDEKGGLLKVVSLANNSIAYDIKPTANGWVYVVSGSEKDGIYTIDKTLESAIRLKPNNEETLRSPIVTEHWLLYISDHTGIDQVYAQSLQTTETYQVTTRPYGSYFLNWDRKNNRIVMADYTAQGQQIVATAFHDSMKPEASWHKVKVEEKPTPLFMNNLTQFTPPTSNLADEAQYQSQPYSRLNHLWNPHSWSLFYDGDQLSASLTSEDVMEKLQLQLRGGYDVSAKNWFGSVNAAYRTDAGPIYRAVVDKSFNPLDAAESSLGVGVEQPINRYYGVYHSQWLPYIGVEQRSVNQQSSEVTLQYGVGYQRQKERAFQAIDTPSGFAQRLSGQAYLSEQTINWVSESKLTIEGFNERQSVDLSLSFQHLNYPESMLEPSVIFKPVSELGYSAQMQADYRINLGAVGRSFTPLLYWRNTETAFSVLSQQTESQQEVAIGFSVAPNINVLRNANVRLQPRAAIYYQPSSGNVNLRYQVSLGGF